MIDRWSVLLPERIANEEVGAGLEDINRRIDAGGRWRLRLVQVVFWTGLRALGYAMKMLGRRKTT